MIKTPLSDLPFGEAIRLWHRDSVEQYISPRTSLDHEHFIRTLERYFGATPLSLGSPNGWADEIEHYQKLRSQTAGAEIINHELSLLGRFLKRIGLWGQIRGDYQPLKVPECERGMALSDAQQEKLFRIASGNPNFKTAYYAAMVMVNTTAGPGELRGIRLQDVDMERRVIKVVLHVKNRYRVRPIPLNQVAYWAMSRLLEVARDKGSVSPEHFLLPFRPHRGKYEPSRPASQWFMRTAWRAMLAGADLPKTVRVYDLRHTAITRLLEDPDISEQTVIDLAGQISTKMLKRYSHLRMKLKRQAVEVLDSALVA